MCSNIQFLNFKSKTSWPLNKITKIKIFKKVKEK